ncbi:hypothetical protein [Glutamicibacter endophyticus]|uniref:hypothetical protein n=1 Tax=Glutamicibacter endophyticus TaxID=1522174 RepID=UPI003AF1CD64
MKRFQLIDKPVIVAGEEVLLVMIERTDQGTIVHWRVQPTPVGEFPKFPIPVLEDLDTDELHHYRVANSGGTGTEDQVQVVYSCHNVRRFALKEANAQAIVYSEG